MRSAIQIFAGSEAKTHIQQRGFRPQDVRVIIGASGGPKWFVLSNLDRYLINEWLPHIDQPLDLVGSSIGAWRMSAYANTNALQRLEMLEHSYLNQRYSARPTAKEVSQSIASLLDSFIEPQELTQHHALRKLHIVAARTRGLCRVDHKTLQSLAFAGVAAANAISRHSLPVFFDRVIFHSPQGRLPLAHWDRFRTTLVELDTRNYRQALFASGAIPVVVEGVRNPHGAPSGMYRDGGMVDYHFDLPFKPPEGLVLYPHFSPLLKPGWFDKGLPWRKVQASNYARTLVVCPSPAFIESLPYQKIPERKDYRNFDNASRIRYWQQVIEQNNALAEALDNWLHSPDQAAVVRPIEQLAR